jgi:vancomycin resistance protein VanJ
MVSDDRACPQVPTATKSPFCRRFLAIGGWVILAVTIAGWSLLRAGDLWAPATLAMFAPLRFAILPSVVLIVAAAVFHRRALRTLVPAFLLTAGPVVGFCVPWDRLRSDPTTGPRIRVLTCNMHYATVPTDPLDRLIDETAPDVVALQEWSEKSRSEILDGREWHVHRESGHFLASRHPIRAADRLGAKSTGDHGSVLRYELETPAGVVTLFSIHLASPRTGLGEVAAGDTLGLDQVVANSELRWTQSRNLAAEAGLVRGPVLLVGDLNTPPHSAIFRRVWGGYSDAFASTGWGWGHTFSARLSAVRIDYVLVGGEGRALRCWVGPNVGSPHCPVLADVAWSPTAQIAPARELH